MIIGIHPDKTGKISYSAKWQMFLEARGVEVRRLDLLAQDGLDQARRCDGVMWHWLHNPDQKQSAKQILHVIEHQLNISVFPNMQTAWHYDEKVSQHYLLQALPVSTPKTWLFWEREQALAWANSAVYPVVFKLSSGAGSSNVLKVEGVQEAQDLIRTMFDCGIFPYGMNEFEAQTGLPRSIGGLKQMVKRMFPSGAYFWLNQFPPLPKPYWKPEYGYAYFQEFLPDNAFDTRITVIGGRAFGFRRMNRENDFRASGSGRIDFSPDEIDLRCVEMAFQASRTAGFQSMAYDFLVKAGEPVVCEISYTFADWAVHDCPGHWTPDMGWVAAPMWPEEAQVIDFLARIRVD